MAKKTKATSKVTGKPAKAKAGKGANGTVKEAVAAAVPETPETLPAEPGPKFGAPEPPPATVEAPAPAEPKPAKGGRSAASAALPAKKLSALEAAAKVLGETKTPMTTQELIDAMASKGYWTSPGGATPAATLYAAILREQKVKGKEARFVKTERGKFTLA